MKADVVTDLAGLPAIEDEWRRLAELRGNAFLTPEWYRAWWRDDGPQTPLVVVARGEGGAVAGVLPLLLHPSGRPRAIRYAGAGFGDRFGIAAAHEDEDDVAVAAIGALEAELGSLPMLSLQRVDVKATWPEALAASATRRLSIVEQSRAEEPHAPVKGMDWEGYLAGRSVKFRQRIGRGIERRLDKDGVALSVRETANAAELEADMELLWRIHELRHPGSESSVADPAVRGALAEFARGALKRGWLRLRVLELDGDVAAVTLCWRIGPSYAFYQGGFDPAWAERHPGLLIANVTVRSAIEEGAEDVDFLLGNEDYKWRFASDARVVHTLVLVRARSAARVVASAEAFARRRGRGLAQHPRFGAFARKVARMLPSQRSG